MTVENSWGRIRKAQDSSFTIASFRTEKQSHIKLSLQIAIIYWVQKKTIPADEFLKKAHVTYQKMPIFNIIIVLLGNVTMNSKKIVQNVWILALKLSKSLSHDKVFYSNLNDFQRIQKNNQTGQYVLFQGIGLWRGWDSDGLTIAQGQNDDPIYN